MKPKLSKVKNIIGEEESAYLIEYRPQGSVHTIVGELMPDTPAGKAGILRVIKYYRSTIKKYSAGTISKPCWMGAGRDVKIVVARGQIEKTITLKSASSGDQSDTGAGKETLSSGLSPATAGDY